MEKRKRVAGRQKGTPNKSTTKVKQAFELAFEGLGGVDSLIAWGRDNPTEFYKLWAKLLPKNIHAKVEDEIKPQVVLYWPENGRDGAVPPV